MDKKKNNGCVISDGIYPGDCEFTQALLKKAASRQTTVNSYAWKACIDQARAVKLLLLDVDGVLTDGTISYDYAGREIKTFHARDGFGMNLLRQAGIEIGLITARSSEALLKRAAELKIPHVYQGKRQKVEVFNELLVKLDLSAQQVAYMGDDWLDLPLLTRVGLSAAPADAASEIREIVNYTTRQKGGRGAVRELCDLLIDAGGLHEKLLKKYLTPFSPGPEK